MRITICWSNISGYMAACWKALAAYPDVELRIIAFDPRTNPSAPFDPTMVDELDIELIRPAEPSADAVIRAEEDRGPDVLVVPGWFHRPYMRLAARLKQRGTPVWMTLDHGWHGTMRQQLSCLAHRRYVRSMTGVFVAGERARQYALRLGIKPDCIVRGLYGFDHAAFAPLADARQAPGASQPRRFLFVGRYVPVKGLDTLLAGYRLYRESVRDPWPIDCCGRGPLGAQLAGVLGVTDHGFTQPADLEARLAAAGAFVLPSTFEPWGVVLAEAMGSGLPVICTEACGASVELVHPFHNGEVVPPNSATALAKAMRWIHEMHEEDWRQLCRGASESAAAYSNVVWARRWKSALSRPTHE